MLLVPHARGTACDMASSSYAYRSDLETLPDIDEHPNQPALVFRSERLAPSQTFINRFSLNGFRNDIGSITMRLGISHFASFVLKLLNPRLKTVKTADASIIQKSGFCRHEASGCPPLYTLSTIGHWATSRKNIR